MDAEAEFQEKLKYYAALEKKVRRLLLKEENEEAVKVLIQIIRGYKSIGIVDKAKIFEDELRNFATAINLNLEKFLELQESGEESEKILGFIESLEKKVKRRILQGKTQDAIKDLKYIISELRSLQHLEKAELLESIMNQFITELSAMSGGTAPMAPISTSEADSIYYPTASTAFPNKLPSPTTKLPVDLKAEYVPHISELLPTSNQERPLQKPPMAPPTASAATPIKPLIPTVIPIPPPRTPSAPPMQPTIDGISGTKSASTIKDQPYSEEELLLKKLIEIKDMLGKK